MFVRDNIRVRFRERSYEGVLFIHALLAAWVPHQYWIKNTKFDAGTGQLKSRWTLNSAYRYTSYK